MSQSTPIKFSVLRNINKKEEILLEGIKSIKSDKNNDSIEYEFEFNFDGNPNTLRIKIKVNFILVHLVFTGGKEQLNWAQNNGNNEFGIEIEKLLLKDSKTLFGFKNKMKSKIFGNKNKAKIILNQLKTVNNKTTSKIIFSENIQDNEYAITLNIQEKNIPIEMIFNKGVLAISHEDSKVKVEIGEIPCLSTTFKYLPK